MKTCLKIHGNWQYDGKLIYLVIFQYKDLGHVNVGKKGAYFNTKYLCTMYNTYNVISYETFNLP